MKFLQVISLFLVLSVVVCQPIEKHQQNDDEILNEVTNYGEKAGETLRQTLNQYGKPIAEAIADSGKSYYDMAVNFMNKESTKDSINKGLQEAGIAVYDFGKKMCQLLELVVLSFKKLLIQLVLNKIK